MQRSPPGSVLLSTWFLGWGGIFEHQFLSPPLVPPGSSDPVSRTPSIAPADLQAVNVLALSCIPFLCASVWVRLYKL